MSMAIRVERDAPMKMRDGVTLRADVFRPDDREKHPAIVVRTPYNKIPSAHSDFLSPLEAAFAGYAVVIQDTRGRFASEGEYITGGPEGADGGLGYRIISAVNFDAVTIEFQHALQRFNGLARVTKLQERSAANRLWFYEMADAVAVEEVPVKFLAGINLANGGYIRMSKDAQRCDVIARYDIFAKGHHSLHLDGRKIRVAQCVARILNLNSY